MKFKHILLVSICSATVGCTSPPPVLKSQIELVAEQNSNFQSVPEKYWGPLLELKKGKSIEFDNRVFIAKSEYVSALGNPCLKISVSNVNKQGQSEYIVCQSSKSEWVYAPSIVILAPDAQEVERL